EECRKALCRMVIIYELSFRFVENEVNNDGSNSVAIIELSKQLTKWGTNLMGGSHLHIRCMAHIVNLIVHDGTKEANVCINRVRQAVRYIRQSPARWKKFQKCCENENLAKKSSCLDVPTRWNSTYMILNRVIDYEGAIVEYADPDIDLALHLKYLDHDMLHQIFIFLEICQVGVYLNLLISNEDHVLAKMAENMKEKFDKYWGDTEKMNKMVFIPCVLDPRHKFSTLGFALKKMLGEKGAVVKIGVRTYMESLFNEYTKPISKDKNGQCSSTEVDTSDSRFVDSRSVGGLGNFFEELQKHTSEKGGAKIEVGKSDFNVLLWWKVNPPRFPLLSEMARDVLMILVSNFIMPRLHGSNARSHVWNHYEKLKEKEDGSWTVKCVHCGRVTYHHSHKTGTASLRKHVKHCLENRNQNRQLLRIDDYWVMARPYGCCCCVERRGGAGERQR
ncbi:hypothetical protein KY290_037101, partial [Solanum tuberosum]